MRRAEPQVDLAVVSYFNPADLVGGAERVAWAEAELMSQTKRVVFLAASAPVDGASFSQLRLGGWTRALFQPAGGKRNPLRLALFHLFSLFNPLVFFESLSMFRRMRPQVVHTHNLSALSPAIWLSARLCGALVLHTHHDLWLICERATMSDREGRPCNESQLTCQLCRALRAPKRGQLRAVSAEVFPSRWLRDRLGRQGPIVPGFSTSSPTDALVPRPAAPATVVFVGSLTAHKVGALLAAFELASASGAPPMRLAVAGTGPLAGTIAAAAQTNPDISYLGVIDEEARSRLLGQASVVLIPSTWPETSSLVFFEALAAGVPVIASAIGALSEHERFGSLVLVPPGDARELAEALVSVLADRGRLDLLRAEARRHRDAASPERFVADVNRVIGSLTAAACTASDSAGKRRESAPSASDQSR